MALYNLQVITVGLDIILKMVLLPVNAFVEIGFLLLVLLSKQIGKSKHVYSVWLILLTHMAWSEAGTSDID